MRGERENWRCGGERERDKPFLQAGLVRSKNGREWRGSSIYKMMMGEGPIRTRLQKVRSWKVRRWLFSMIRSGSRSAANSQSRYTLVHEYLTRQRLRSGFYSVLLRTVSRSKMHQLDYRSYVVCVCVCAFFITVPANRRVLRYETTRRAVGD